MAIYEDGTGVADADAAINEAFLEAYAEAAGKTIPSGDVEAGIVRGTAAISGKYGSRFPGERTHGREQGLPWPRIGACDTEGRAIPSNVLPIEYKKAVAEATLIEMEAPGSFMPNQSGAAVKSRREEVGALKRQIDYAVADGQRPSMPSFPLIDGILAPLIGGGFGGSVRIMRA